MSKCWNKCWYIDANVFKVKFRDHYCYKCGEKLMIVKHRKVVNQKSEEAKYYNFDAGGDATIMVGPCEFIHKLFFCPKCSQNIEFITQINQEDIDIIIQKTVIYFKKRNREVLISKGYETKQEDLIKNDFSFNDNIVLCLRISEKGKESKVYKIPITRSWLWERPYYFNISKRKLINFVK